MPVVHYTLTYNITLVFPLLSRSNGSVIIELADTFQDGLLVNLIHLESSIRQYHWTTKHCSWMLCHCSLIIYNFSCLDHDVINICDNLSRCDDSNVFLFRV